MKSLKELVKDARIRKANKKLITEYPFLMVRNVFTGKPLEDPYSTTWLDFMPDG